MFLLQLQQLFPLLLLLLPMAISVLFAHPGNGGDSSSSSALHQADASLMRARRHAVAKSRQRAANAECLVGYRERIELHCRYPHMEQPCLQPADSDSEGTDLAATAAKAVDQMAQRCCDGSHHQLCSVDDFEELCCRSLDCLAKCYGDGFLESARSRFRYLDILLHPHDSRRKEAPEAALLSEPEEQKLRTELMLGLAELGDDDSEQDQQKEQ